MSRSPLVHQLEDREEFSLDPLTDSTRPGVQTALIGLPPADPGPPPPTFRQRVDRYGLAVLWVVVMSASSAVRWGL